MPRVLEVPGAADPRPRPSTARSAAPVPAATFLLASGAAISAPRDLEVPPMAVR